MIEKGGKNVNGARSLALKEYPYSYSVLNYISILNSDNFSDVLISNCFSWMLQRTFQMSPKMLKALRKPWNFKRK